jgi:hypothetical protein
MKEFWEDFSDTSNFPMNVYVVLTVLAAPLTGWALGARFGLLLFNPAFPPVVGGAALTLLLLAGALAPLYFADFPLASGWRRGAVALLMAGALYLTYRHGADVAAWLGVYQHLSMALCFWGPALLALLAMFEPRDDFEARQDTGPGVWAIIRGRIVMAWGAALKLASRAPGIWAAIRRRVVMARQRQ